MTKTFFTLNDQPINYTTIDNVDEISIVIENCTADFVIRAINHALRQRALSNLMAGIEQDSLSNR